MAGLVGGFDRYLDGHGQLRWKLLGVVPVTQAEGPDVTRSAVGRVAGEAMWLPTALLPRFGVEWEASDDRHVNARSAWMGSPLSCTITWGTMDGSVRWSLTAGAILTAVAPGGCTRSAAR